MSGKAIINYLLSNSAGLTAVVTADRIVSSIAPLSMAMPNISLTEIDAVRHLNLAVTAGSHLATARIQVTVRTEVDADKETILALVRAACPLSYGTVNGFTCRGVIPDIGGPDLDNPESGIYSKSQDFLVHFVRTN